MFYKETDFKEEPFIGEIPKDWDVAKLGDKSISEIIMGQSPPSSTYNKDGVGLPFLQGKMEFGDIYPKVLVYCSKPIKIAEPNDVLFSVRAPVGDVNLAPYKLCIGRGLAAIRFNNERVSHSFYFYWFQKIKKHLEALGKGSTFKAVNKDDLENLRVPLPPLNEQRGIVGVLGVVDSVIAKTGEVIAKAERLKKGLMQTLLTRGIGHKEYKQTPIGTTPKTWKVVRVEDVTSQIIDSPHKIPIKEKSGIPFVSVNYMLRFPDYNFFIDETIDEIEYISEEDSQEFLKRFNPEKEDILYSKWGTPGIAKLINTERKFIGSCSVALIKTRKDIIDSLYLVYALNSQTVQHQIIPYSKTSTRTEIHIGHIKRIKIPLPPLEEQKEIVKVLSTVDRKLAFERNEKTRLECIKRGLMDLLLTGKIRVKVD